MNEPTPQPSLRTISADLQNTEKTVEVVVNAGSGVGDKDDVVRELETLFAEQNIAVRISLIGEGDDFEKTLEKIVASGAQTIVAAGGDGTISAVAAKLINTEKTLGVLPLGTLNHFSKDLLIPQELADAVRVVAENYTEKVDVGEVNGRIFINNSSLGLYPRIVRRRARQQKSGYSKWYAAFWASVSIFSRYPFLDLKLRFERKFIERRTPIIFVGNNEYEIHGMSLGGRKSLRDGLLSVYVLHRTGRLGLLMLGVRSLFGALRDAEDFDEFLTDEIVIEKRRKRKRTLVAYDGEVTVMESPIRYRILPGALRVVVPKPNRE